MVKNSSIIKNQLSKALCFKCGSSLDTAKIVPISEMALGTVSHAVCSVCKAENMLTITSIGTGVIPTASDLTSEEILKFANSSPVRLEDVLNLHKELKKDSLCNLLQKKEKYLGKKPKS